MIPLPVKRGVYRALGIPNFLLTKALYQLGHGYEKSYASFLKLLPVGGRLLDIGANIGVTSAYAGWKRPDLKVVAIEPILVNFVAAKRLCRVLHIKNVDFHQVALGDSTGTVEMVMPKIGSMLASAQTYLVHEGYDYSSIPDEGGERFSVPLTMVDSMDLPRIDGIKLDVENFEFHVLRGAVQLLKRDHPIIYCELWDTPNRRKVMDLLDGFGYSCEKMETKEDFLFR